MALKAPSLFHFGLQITETNRYLNFSAGAGEFTAVLTLGYYSLTQLVMELKRALEEADLDNTYSVTVDRTVNLGMENRITIASSAGSFEILFNSGSNSGNDPSQLLGFDQVDYTGSTSYTTNRSSGKVLITNRSGNDWISPEASRRVQAAINEAASGLTEILVYSSVKLFQVHFPWIPENELSLWVELLDWISNKRTVDFTPEITTPNIFYHSILESTAQDSNGLSFSFKETPKGTGLYDVGLLKFRVVR